MHTAPQEGRGSLYTGIQQEKHDNTVLMTARKNIGLLAIGPTNTIKERVIVQLFVVLLNLKILCAASLLCPAVATGDFFSRHSGPADDRQSAPAAKLRFLDGLTFIYGFLCFALLSPSCCVPDAFSFFL